MKVRGLALSLLLLVALSSLGQEAPSTPASQETLPTAATPSATPSPDLTPGPDGKLSQEQMQQLFRVVAEKHFENQRRRRNYTYIDHEVNHNLDGQGHAKSTDVNTYEILEIYGEPVRRLIEKDDKPLNAKEAAKEEEKIQKIIDKRKDESDEDRRKREEKETKEREDGRKFLREVADAYDFRNVGTEELGGREVWVIDGEPRPGYEPQMKDAKVLSKFHGRVWIDKGDLQLAKLEIEALDTVSIGWILARIHKGTRFMMQQTRVNDEVWLPEHVTFLFDARVALFKGYNIDGDEQYRDYRKFRTSAKIVGVGEVKEEK